MNRMKEKEKIRKETVEEILNILLELAKEQGSVVYDIDMKEVAKGYGVEVEE